MKDFKPMMTPEQKKKMLEHKKKMEKMNGDVDGGIDYYWARNIEFSDKQLPEIDDWKVGDTYKIEVLVKMTSYEAKDKPGKNCARFEVIGVRSSDGKLSDEQKKIVKFMVGNTTESEDDDND